MGVETYKKIHGAKFGKYVYLDFIFDTNKCEMGMTCYVKVTLDKTTDIKKFCEEFFNKYKLAHDSQLETTRLDFIKVGDIPSFIKGRKKKSNGLSSALDMLWCRFHNEI